MIVNRSGSKIFGAHLTKVERQALDIEAKKSVVKHNKQYHLDLDSAFLYYFHTKFGYGAKRLRGVWDDFNKLHDEVVRHYMVDSEDAAWVCREKLKQIGVDVKAWYEEDERKAKENENE